MITTMTTIKIIVDKGNHAINGAAMVGDAEDGANAPHITDGGNAHNNNSHSQIGEDANNEDSASINANVKRRMTKNPNQIKNHKMNPQENAHLIGCGGTGPRREDKCNSHNANLNVQIGVNVKDQNNAQSHVNHLAVNVKKGTTVAIVSRQMPVGGSGHKGKDRCKCNNKIHAQVGGHAKEEDVAWLQINLLAENVHEGTIATSTALHSGSGGSGHKDKDQDKCNNNGQIGGDINGHNNVIRHAIRDYHHPGFGGLGLKDKGKFDEDG